MKTFKVNQDSLSFKFANHLSFAVEGMGDDRWGKSYPKDFCTYWRHVILWSPLMIITLMAILCLAGAMLFIAIQTPSESIFAIMFISTVTLGLLGVEWLNKKLHIWRGFLWLMNHGPIQVLSFIFRPIGWVLSWLFVKFIDFCVWGAEVWEKIRGPKRAALDGATKRPSMLMQKYASIKRKYCPMVEYVKSDAEAK
jgi:hypothetical protein